MAPVLGAMPMVPEVTLRSSPPGTTGRRSCPCTFPCKLQASDLSRSAAHAPCRHLHSGRSMGPSLRAYTVWPCPHIQGDFWVLLVAIKWAAGKADNWELRPYDETWLLKSPDENTACRIACPGPEAGLGGDDCPQLPPAPFSQHPAGSHPISGLLSCHSPVPDVNQEGNTLSPNPRGHSLGPQAPSQLCFVLASNSKEQPGVKALTTTASLRKALGARR